MFFAYIIQFLIVLFIHLGQPHPGPEASGPVWWWSGAILANLAAFALLARQVTGRCGSPQSLVRWEARLGWLAVIIYAVDVYLLDLKGFIGLIPGARQAVFLDGLVGISIFYLHLVALWAAELPTIRRVLEPGLELGEHVKTQLRFTIPLLIPWFLMALIYDLIDLLAPKAVLEVTKSTPGEMGLMILILVGLTLFMPPLVVKAWGCRPIPDGGLRWTLTGILAKHRARVREILIWPLLRGRMVTAGVMGILPGLRYLMLTPELVRRVDPAELEAVVAHEIGHLKHRHLLLYLLFFLGYLFLAYALGGLVVSGMLFFEPTTKLLLTASADSMLWFSLLVSGPMLLLMIVYFRFIFAYFMRHFERQADAYAAQSVGPGPVISALETIAFHAGLDRNAPSWHHFSIAQRADFLGQLAARPGLYKTHAKRLKKAMALYLAGLLLIVGLVLPTGLLQGPEELNYNLVLAALDQALEKTPDDPRIHLYQAMLLTMMERPLEAARAYERTIGLAPNEPTALNDLAWLLVTGPQELRDPVRALKLAKRAVHLKPEPALLDTLAEAYFANGIYDQAIRHAKIALAHDPDDREYFEKQLKKFEKALRGE